MKNNKILKAQSELCQAYSKHLDNEIREMRITLCISRKEHDALMDKNHDLYQRLMKCPHTYGLGGLIFNDLTLSLKHEVKENLKEPRIPIVTPQIPPLKI